MSDIIDEKRIIARETSRMLLEVQAVLFNAREPFKFTSGRASPVYIDGRKLISYPRLRRRLLDFAVTTLEREVGYEAFDAVAGGETAGIPYCAWLAERLQLPMLYVRKKPKGFGRNAQIEGYLSEGSRVLLVEDLATDAGSKVNFTTGLRTAGAKVDHAFVVFFYGIFPVAQKKLDDLGIKLHWLATWWDVLQVAKDSNHFDSATLAQVESFLHQPEEWSLAHGGTPVAGAAE